MVANEKEFLSLDPDGALRELIALATDKGVLKRVTLSLPTDKTVLRATLTPRSIGGKTVLQLETFYTDNKARHRNLAPTDGDALAEVLAVYRQVNVLTTLPSGDCERKTSASGKQTILRGAKLYRLLVATASKSAEMARNDREKQYILNGSEPFLRALGVSDENGRVYDKKRSKFRQINRFLELLRDVEDKLPKDGLLRVSDLCCGKSYLSFAVYHYLTAVKGYAVEMHCVDLKSDVIADCASHAERLGMTGLHFVCGDVAAFEPEGHVHLVVSLHACDTATDLVLGKAMRWQSEVVLSTPCCHHELNHTLDCPELACIAAHSMLRQKLCDAATDAMRLLLLEAHGYAVEALELIDPEETPKNVMLRAVKKKNVSAAALARAHEDYAAA
ncbi:MAG: SAM-dependent methyltransferase, partial [Clostridia bacterium]|nr:SAM-dependent methyltransferase [Clostridia bacterium]